MSKQTIRRKRDGRWADDICADGEEVVCPLFMADAFRRDLVRSFGSVAAADLHRPGFRVLDRAGRDRVQQAGRT